MSADDAVKEKSKRRRKRRGGEPEETTSEETVDENRGITESKGRATPGKRTQKASEAQSGNAITRGVRGIREYFSGVQDELDKVVWPTREELLRLTRIVLLVTIASAAVLGLVSFIYTEIFILGIRDDNPIVFAALFVLVGLGYTLSQRMSNQDNPPPF
jgi:preprotein translocase subunit SecE